ncbi:MAG: molybdate ABC transporter substrate-binding protein [Caldisericum sp.]|uniref:molybdate ABC transporter substrate-binding protein n=1 Tax=Caldisericum sp. TaxID=2499687 RepID=UPI003D11965B
MGKTLRKILLAMLTLIVFVGFTSCKKESKLPILMYAGAGLKGPVDEIVDIYNKKTGITVNVIYGGSGTLLAQIENTKKGDIFMPGGLDHYKKAEEKGFIEKGVEFVYHEPVIVVKKGNPKNIRGLLDLKSPGLKLALGDETSLSIGPITKKMFEKAGIYNEVLKNVVVREGTVNKLVLDVDTTDIDASIVWKTAESQFGKNVEAIPIEKQYLIVEKVPISILKFSENKDGAEKFMNFVLSDEGINIFKKYGYEVINK